MPRSKRITDDLDHLKHCRSIIFFFRSLVCLCSCFAIARCYLGFIIYFIHLRILCICMHSCLADASHSSLSVFLTATSFWVRECIQPSDQKFFLIAYCSHSVFILSLCFIPSPKSKRQRERWALVCHENMKSFNVFCIGSRTSYLIISDVDCILRIFPVHAHCIEHRSVVTDVGAALYFFFFSDTSIQWKPA